jgi:hypothetical protein
MGQCVLWASASYGPMRPMGRKIGNIEVCVLGFTSCPLQGSDFSVVVVRKLLFPKVSELVHFVRSIRFMIL